MEDALLAGKQAATRAQQMLLHSSSRDRTQT
jgi:hypothetical protein